MPKLSKSRIINVNYNDGKRTIYNEVFDYGEGKDTLFKEWEDIIRVINNDESGLSNLYDKHKTDDALTRNVIVPLIESKINGEKNAIEAMRNNLGKYIESYKQSKEALQEVDLLKTFKGEMAPAAELLKQGRLKEEAKEGLYRKLAALAALCEKEFTKKCSEKRQCEDLVEEFKNELTKVYYEEHSLSYYKLLTEEENLQEKLEEVQELLNTKELKHKDLVREKFLQESAEIYEELLDMESSLAEVRERIANYEKEDSEIVQAIRNYKFTLKGIYEAELGELKEKESDLEREEAALKERLKENEKAKNATASEIREYIRQEEGAKNNIRNFDKAETQFKNNYKDFKLSRNPLLNEYNSKELEAFSLNIDNNISFAQSAQAGLNNENASLLLGKENLKAKETEANKELRGKGEALKVKENDLSAFYKETSKVLEVLRIKNLPLSIIDERERLGEMLVIENVKYEEAIKREQSRLIETEDKIQRYETGLIQLPKEVLESFENKGISFKYALNWLQNYKGSREEKETLISNNPFFPYGILLSARDIATLKSESIDVYTSIPIPVISENDLSKILKVDRNNDLLTIENADFLISFNSLLIDEEERKELLRVLRQEAAALNREISNIHKAMDRNKEYALVIANYPYAGDEKEVMESEIEQLHSSIKELEEAIRKYGQEASKNENRRESITKELHALDKSLLALKEKRKNFSEFITQHEEFKSYNSELLNIKKAVEAVKKREAALKEEGSELHAALKDIALKAQELGSNIKNTSSKQESYINVQEGSIVKEKKNILEARLSSCEKKLGDDVKRDKELERDISKRHENAQKRLNRKIKEGNLSSEYKNVQFSDSKLAEVNSDIKTFEEHINKLKNDFNALDKELAKIIERKQRELEDIQKLNFDEPISKELINDSNFRAREKKIKEDLKQNDEIIREYSGEIDRLKSIKQKLEGFRLYASEASKVDLEFKDLNALDKRVDENIAAFEALKREIYQIESKLSKEIITIHDRYRDKNRFIKERLLDYFNKERKIASHSDIESLLEIVDRKVRTLEQDLMYIKSEEEMVINETLRYAEHVLQELKTIDKKSYIKHLGKTQKLLEISIPEEKEIETLKEYIKGRVYYYGSYEGDYTALLEGDIQSAELLSKLIGSIDRIRVDIKKIEKSGLVRKSWKDALSQNSGGEKFVSMFILLSSLMSYMRKRETDIDNKEEKKTLIMDNPFAKTNAEHLLEPMFQIAEKYNIQLLCFSGIGGSSVYNRFDKIYVAKVVEDKFRNKENVSFKAGTEETLEMSDFTITKEQISLF